MWIMSQGIKVRIIRETAPARRSPSPNEDSAFATSQFHASRSWLVFVTGSRPIRRSSG
jgi:hypothetical protein